LYTRDLALNRDRAGIVHDMGGLSLPLYASHQLSGTLAEINWGYRWDLRLKIYCLSCYPACTRYSAYCRFCAASCGKTKSN